MPTPIYTIPDGRLLGYAPGRLDPAWGSFTWAGFRTVPGRRTIKLTVHWYEWSPERPSRPPEGGRWFYLGSTPELFEQIPGWMSPEQAVAAGLVRILDPGGPRVRWFSLDEETAVERQVRHGQEIERARALPFDEWLKKTARILEESKG